MRRLPGSRVLVVSALLAFLPCATAAESRTLLRPVLGDWEGVGPHGLPLSFALSSERTFVHGRRVQEVVMRNLVIAYPTACLRARESRQAFAYPRVEYTGPGAPPVTFHFKRPDQFQLTLLGAPGFKVGIPVILQGRLLGARSGVLFQPQLQHPTDRSCGWPMKTFTWRLHPGKRRKVADGTWKGTVAAPGGVTGAVSATVGADGRTVDRFQIDHTCTDGTTSTLKFSPALFVATKPTSEFISSSGAIRGWGPNVNGVQTGWRGRFGSDGMLRGTFTDFCGGTEALNGSFSARRTSP